MAKNDITVDQFVKIRVMPEFQPIVEILRAQGYQRRRAPLLHQAGAGIRQ
jgi:hypothetical protein